MSMTQAIGDPSTSKSEIAAMAKWFGQGAVDVDAMLRYGVLSEETLIRNCKVLIDSPWYDPVVAAAVSPVT
jgi:hypothetical protein